MKAKNKKKDDNPYQGRLPLIQSAEAERINLLLAEADAKIKAARRRLAAALAKKAARRIVEERQQAVEAAIEGKVRVESSITAAVRGRASARRGRHP